MVSDISSVQSAIDEKKKLSVLVIGDAPFLIISLIPFILFRCGILEGILFTIYILGFSMYLAIEMRRSNFMSKIIFLSVLFYHSCILMYFSILYICLAKDLSFSLGIWDGGIMRGILLLLLFLAEAFAFSILPFIYFVKHMRLKESS